MLIGVNVDGGKASDVRPDSAILSVQSTELTDCSVTRWPLCLCHGPTACVRPARSVEINPRPITAALSLCVCVCVCGLRLASIPPRRASLPTHIALHRIALLLAYAIICQPHPRLVQAQLLVLAHHITQRPTQTGSSLTLQHLTCTYASGSAVMSTFPRSRKLKFSTWPVPVGRPAINSERLLELLPYIRKSI